MSAPIARVDTHKEELQPTSIAETVVETSSPIEDYTLDSENTRKKQHEDKALLDVFRGDVDNYNLSDSQERSCDDNTTISSLPQETVAACTEHTPVLQTSGDADATEYKSGDITEVCESKDQSTSCLMIKDVTVGSPESELSFAERLQRDALLQTENLRLRIEKLKWRNNRRCGSVPALSEDIERKTVLEEEGILQDPSEEEVHDEGMITGTEIQAAGVQEDMMLEKEMQDDGIASESCTENAVCDEDIKLQLESDSEDEDRTGGIQDLDMEAGAVNIADGDREPDDMVMAERETEGQDDFDGEEGWTQMEAETGADMPDLCEVEVESDHELPLDEDYLMYNTFDVVRDTCGLENEVWTPDMDVLLCQEMKQESTYDLSQDNGLSPALNAAEDDDNERNVWSHLIEPIKHHRRKTLHTVDPRDDIDDTYPSLTKCISHIPHVLDSMSESLSTFRQKLYSAPPAKKLNAWGPKCCRDGHQARIARQQKCCMMDHSYSMTPVASEELGPPTLTQEISQCTKTQRTTQQNVVDMKLSQRAVVVVPDIVKVLLQGY